MNIVHGGDVTIRGMTADDDFACTVTIHNYEEASPEVKEALTASGATWSATYGTLTFHGAKIVVDQSPVHSPGVEFSLPELPAGVSAYIDSDGKVWTDDLTQLQPGGLTVSVVRVGARGYFGAKLFATNYGLQRTCSYDFRVTSYPAGGLARHVVDAVNAMLSGETPGASSQDLYSSNNFNSASPSAVRNASNIAAGYDYSGVSIVNGATGKARQGYLVSGRHVIGAHHFFPDNPIVWLTADGTTYRTANVLSWQRIGSTDIRVGYLDTEIVGATPFKLLPADYLDYLPTLRRADFDYSAVSHSVPTFLPNERVAFNQLPALAIHLNLPWGGTGQAFVVTALSAVFAQSMTDLWTADDTNLTHKIDKLDGYDSWKDAAQSGDSGGGIFLPVNGELVLLSTYYTIPQSPNFANYLSDINSAMNALATAAGDPAAGTYAVQTANLSGFTNYA